MMLPSWCRKTVTVYRAPIISERGTKVRDWSQASTHTLTGCDVQLSSTAGTWGDPRDGAQTDAVLYAPPGADIEFGDRIEYAGVTYAIDGVPLAHDGATGNLAHVVANLVVWRG